MPGLSSYSAQRLYDLMLNPSTREKPVFLALHRGYVDDNAYSNEMSYGGYARQPVDSFYATMESGTDGEVTLVARNGSVVIFPTSSGPDMTVTHWAIWDAQTVGSGNVLFSGVAPSPRVIETGDAPYVRPDELEIFIL
jgi:hypothetical protein